MTNLSKKFIVLGSKTHISPDSYGVSDTDLIVVGLFSKLEDAVMCRDIHADLDTTFDAVTIVSSEEYDSVPDMNIYLHLSFDDENLIIRSQCVFEDSNPFLRVEEDYFEALAYPEDREAIIDRAVDWYHSITGQPPIILDYVSPAAKEFF